MMRWRMLRFWLCLWLFWLFWLCFKIPEMQER
jgi:hypothetical protein